MRNEITAEAHEPFFEWANTMLTSPAKFKFCFTLDTEPDDLWASKKFLSFDHFRLLPAFHASLVASGARPTYLTTSEVAESREARQAMEACLSKGGCEIGAHFHAWTREWPFRPTSFGNERHHVMAHCLGREVEERMLDFTCQALRASFGITPKSYRGGRWSFGPESPRSLANCGIEVDSSVVPGLSFANPSSPMMNGPDYRERRCYPEFLETDGARILELPVGAAWPRFLPSLAPALAKPTERLGQIFGPRFGHAWLRPSYQSVAAMRQVMRRLREERVPVWVIMMHSSEIVPCTPLPSQKRVDACMRRCHRAIETAIELGAAPATLSEAAAWWQSGATPSELHTS